jgi:hypothetical protein
MPWIEERGFWSTVFKNSGFQSRRFPGAPVDMAFHGDPGVPDGMVDLDRNNFQPRFGFAYSPARLRNTVLRGGFGMFNERNNVDIIQNTGQPFQFNQEFFAIEQLSDPLRGLGNLPLARETTNPVFRPPFSMSYPDRTNSRNGYILHYNLMVQREFGGNLSIEAGYIGKLSRKLSRSVAANPAIFVPNQSTSANIEARRIFRPGIYSGLTESSNSANANYDSFQVEVIRRMARGFTIQGAYTLAKSIDDVSGVTLGGTTPNPFDWSSARGVSDFDQLHNANVSFVFELPKLGQAPYHRILLNDWELSGILTARSGTPFSVFSGGHSSQRNGQPDGRRGWQPGEGAHKQSRRDPAVVQHLRVLGSPDRQVRQHCQEHCARTGHVGRQPGCLSKYSRDRKISCPVPQRILQPAEPYESWYSEQHHEQCGVRADPERRREPRDPVCLKGFLLNSRLPGLPRQPGPSGWTRRSRDRRKADGVRLAESCAQRVRTAQPG